jgi:putative transposase
MIAERGFEVDHSTVHRWVIKLVPLFEKLFRKHKRPVGKGQMKAAKGTAPSAAE